jgi:hypothetical protein
MKALRDLLIALFEWADILCILLVLAAIGVSFL